jgi:magnesium-protoporphyrin O-methyltransferase
VSCCGPRFYGKVFSERTARRNARQYRRKGLRGSARDTFEFLRPRVPGRSVLEIGGGVGAIELELLKAGAARATNVELSPSYEPVAAELAREAGVEERFRYRVANIAEAEVEGADAVVLHRVVCCYPDGEELTRRAAALAARDLVLTFPRETPWNRAAFALFNFALWTLRLKFRAYVHPVRVLVAAAESEGLALTYDRPRAVWQTVALTRV